MNATDRFLIQAYLDGDLDPASAEEFEILLLRREDLAQLVEADSALRIGMAELKARATSALHGPGETKGVKQRRADVGSSRLASTQHGPGAGESRRVGASVRVIRRRSKWALGVPFGAAAVALLGVGISLGRSYVLQNEAFELGRPVRLERMRGIGDVQQIAMPASGTFVFSLDASSARTCPAVPHTRLSRSETVIFDRATAPDDLGFVWLIVHPNELGAGRLRFDIVCDTEVVATYWTELVE